MVQAQHHRLKEAYSVKQQNIRASALCGEPGDAVLPMMVNRSACRGQRDRKRTAARDQVAAPLEVVGSGGELTSEGTRPEDSCRGAGWRSRSAARSARRAEQEQRVAQKPGSSVRAASGAWR